MSNPTEPLEIPDVVKHPEPGSHPAKEGTTRAGTVRVGTIVWGAVVVALGILIILTRQAGLSLDAGQTAIWLLFGAGVAMVAGGAINLLRRKVQ
ncbi:hypothetical protein [Arthrobacter glacialis]|uniref:Uncharacterized protein n=1 Tax=Arthrobacter glacialis TaxID=1664 RepID=A0A2S3ZZ48_ARTGL|nr:hypothetical protein [Arthrobacter glacialis]POH74177.1 hypothetical protein CVS27_06305 [Arthrobacter glacialis]